MRQDTVALAAGLIFIIFLLGMMWLWGDLAGWNATSGYTHNDSANSQQRLMSEPFGCDDETIPGRSGAGCVGIWYYWKLPPLESTSVTRAVVWLCYSLHQIFVWGLIYRAQLTIMKQKLEGNNDIYSNDLRWFNWAMLAVNGLFHVLHLVQTHTTYDATAQDVTISSSQSSVIMMICFIILMEYKDRGLIFMWPNPRSEGKAADRVRLHPGPIRLIRKYHGYIFAWSCIYTFWYHPMENTWGHALGFFHTAIVLLQGSLAFTEIHLNRYWRLLNECWVFVHATCVAIQTGNPNYTSRSDLWPIFTFGFGFVFAFTQVFSFPFWRRAPAWSRMVPPIIFLSIVTALCGTIVDGRNGASGFSRMIDMVFIPSQEYLQVLASWFFLLGFMWIESKIKTKNAVDQESAIKAEEKQTAMPSPTKQACYLCGCMIIYTSFILASYFYEQAHYEINMTNAMIAFTFTFSLGACVSTMFLKQLLGPSEPIYPTESNKVKESSEEQYDNKAFEDQRF